MASSPGLGRSRRFFAASPMPPPEGAPSGAAWAQQQQGELQQQQVQQEQEAPEEAVAKERFESWAAAQAAAGAGDQQLQRNLESFLNDTNTSMSQVAAWLEDPGSPRRGASGPYGMHDELRHCLQTMIHDSTGTHGFNEWATGGQLPRSPSNSSSVPDGPFSSRSLAGGAASAKGAAALNSSRNLPMGIAASGKKGSAAVSATGLGGGPSSRPPAHPHRQPTMEAMAGSLSARPPPLSARNRPNLEMFFTLNSNRSLGGPTPLPGAAPRLATARAAGRSAAESAYVSGYLARAQTALNEEIATVDAAQEEVAAWGSTEDEDFVTPWYTYAIRVIMVPLGGLLIYFCYWRIINLVNVNDPGAYDNGEAANANWWQLALAWTFIMCEIIGFLMGMTNWVWMWNLKFRKRVTQAQVGLTEAELPTVDFMVPCYSEPTEIVEMTVKACFDMDYPAEKITIWVLDDGKSEDMREMVARTKAEYRGGMSLRYVARTKIPGVPHHAKAGNLNNCILNEGSSGDLIIILDCDMLPEPCMARTVVPFFFKKPPRGTRTTKPEFDQNVGLLQTPQAFYNLDSKDLLGQSYAFFYECMLSGWDGSGCTPCCGTGVTFNRKALESIGGFAVGSITEDFKTSFTLCSNGFVCKYFLQRMTRGVSPKELNAFMVQRLRWAVGAIQILRSSNPLFTKGLHAKARWLYFFNLVGSLVVIPLILMMSIMYGTIIAGAAVPFGPPSFYEYLAIGGTAVALSMIMQLLTAWRLSWRDYLRAVQDNFTVFATLLRAVLIGFCGMEMGFAVTSKDVTFDLGANLYHAGPHLIVYLFSGVAMAIAVIDVLQDQEVTDLDFRTTELNVNFIWYSMMWTVFLWVMISAPPRMVLYGWLRSRREARSAIKCTNAHVPALQELPSTPMNTFPPLSPELWAKKNQPAPVEELPEEGPPTVTAGGGKSTDSSSSGSGQSAFFDVEAQGNAAPAS